MSIDDRQLRVLTEESQDLHSDAMTTTRRSLDELVELGHESTGLVHTDGPAERLTPTHAGGSCSAASRRPACSRPRASAPRWSRSSRSPAFADKSDGRRRCCRPPRRSRTSRSRPTTSRSTLDFIGGELGEPGREGVRHEDAGPAQGARGRVQRRGRRGSAARRRTSPTRCCSRVVNQAKPTLTGPGARRRPRDRARDRRGRRPTSPTSAPSPTRAPARSPPASWASRRSTSRSSTRCRRSSPPARPSSSPLPPDAAKLPAAAGSVGFPDPFFKTDQGPPRRRRSRPVSRRKQDPMPDQRSPSCVALTDRSRRDAPRDAARRCATASRSGARPAPTTSHEGITQLVSRRPAGARSSSGAARCSAGMALVASGAQPASPPRRPPACGRRASPACPPALARRPRS